MFLFFYYYYLFVFYLFLLIYFLNIYQYLFYYCIFCDLFKKKNNFSAEKPSFINELKRETISEYGSTVILPCEAEGVPLPKISWYRNAESVDHLFGSR